jgi:CTP:molybdopterin cytidylyltransferase MocA
MRLAMECLKEKSSAIMFALVDHPLVKFETYKKLFESAKEMENKILIPSYNHRAGHPIVIPKNAYRFFLQSDKQTARAVIQEHKKLIKYTDVDDENILLNINTKEEWVIKKSA